MKTGVDRSHGDVERELAVIAVALRCIPILRIRLEQ
jgi:hypothetical protein